MNRQTLRRARAVSAADARRIGRKGAGVAHGLLSDLGALLDLGTLRGIRRGFRANDGPGLAAQLAFYLTLALFPLVLVLVSLVGTFSGPRFAAEVLAYFRQILPPPVYGVMEAYAAEALQGLSPAPGVIIAGAAITLWVSSRFFRALILALNRIYGLRKTRPAWKVRLFALLMTLGLSGVVLAGVLLLVAGPSIGGFVAEIFGLGPQFELLWRVARWPHGSPVPLGDRGAGLLPGSGLRPALPPDSAGRVRGGPVVGAGERRFRLLGGQLRPLRPALRPDSDHHTAAHLPLRLLHQSPASASCSAPRRTPPSWSSAAGVMRNPDRSSLRVRESGG